jgi:hypothetical protein
MSEVLFYPETHTYKSADIFDQIEWVSASKLAGMFKKPFDGPATAAKCSLNKKSKWYGLSPEEILGHWEAENKRSTTLGTWYHEKEEARLNGLTTLSYKGTELPIIRSEWENGVKISPSQKLGDGVYTELLLYLKSAGACGQFDRVNIYNGIVDIDDHKSNKDLKKPAFKNWEGKIEKMQPPLMHLENCKLVEYGLQLSIAMYIILRHNPQLRAGEMFLNHVTFETEGENKFGYPIMKMDNGEYIIKDIEKVPVPYLKREVELMFEFIKRKRENAVR